MLREDLQKALKEAMLAHDAATTGAVRLIIAGMKEKDVEARGKGAKEVAWWLCKNGMIEFLGSDLHNIEQANALSAWLSTKEYQKLAQMLPNLQNDLLAE